MQSVNSSCSTARVRRAHVATAARGLQGGNDVDDAGIVERAIVFKHSKCGGERTPMRQPPVETAPVDTGSRRQNPRSPVGLSVRMGESLQYTFGLTSLACNSALSRTCNRTQALHPTKGNYFPYKVVRIAACGQSLRTTGDRVARQVGHR